MIHCTAGKDRTGIFYGILLSFLGVPDEIIAEEYSLTERGLIHWREAAVNRLLQGPGFDVYMRNLMASDAPADRSNGFPPEILEKGKQAALRMMGAKKESMMGALEMVRKEWGDAEGYMRTVCGLEDNELQGLKAALLGEGNLQTSS